MIQRSTVVVSKISGYVMTGGGALRALVFRLGFRAKVCGSAFKYKPKGPRTYIMGF